MRFRLCIFYCILERLLTNYPEIGFVNFHFSWLFGNVDKPYSIQNTMITMFYKGIHCPKGL